MCLILVINVSVCNLSCSASNSDNLLVHTVFLSASLSCYNFIGFHYQFGINYIRDYSNISFVCVNLVREIKDWSLLVVLIYPN